MYLEDMYPEDMFETGVYIDSATGDVWEKDQWGCWSRQPPTYRKEGEIMHPEDLFQSGSYVDSATGDIWEKDEWGCWRVNGLIHRPFPHSLVPEVGIPDGPQGRKLRDMTGYCE